MTEADLREHTSTWGEPIGIDYRGVRATTHPPNSSGVIALEILGILGHLEPPPASAFGAGGVTDAAWIHAGLEASKVALADRDRYLTDPEARDVPVGDLLDPGRLAEIAARIDRSRAGAAAVAVNPGAGDTVYMSVTPGPYATPSSIRNGRAAAVPGSNTVSMRAPGV